MDTANSFSNGKRKYGQCVALGVMMRMKRDKRYNVGTRWWLCVGTHTASVVTNRCAVRLPAKSTEGAAQRRDLSGPGGKAHELRQQGCLKWHPCFYTATPTPKVWTHSVFLKGSLCVCHFSDPDIGAGVLFIKAEETKQQINKLNSEVWRGGGCQNSIYIRSSVM